MREVYVLGVGQTKFTKQPELSSSRLGELAVKEAFKDIGPEFDPRTIQIAYAAHCEGINEQCQDILKFVGVAGIEMHNLENACASGGDAVHALWKDIALGYRDIGIAIGVDSMTRSKIAGGLIPPAEGDIEGLMGLAMPALAGFSSNYMMETRGITEEDLAYATIKNHRNGSLNPYAHYGKPITYEDVKAAKMIADPITVLHCCPQSDGAAAIILCTKEIAKKYTTNLVKVASSLCCSAEYVDWNFSMLEHKQLRKLAKKVYEDAGIDPLKDLDLIELHDAFSPEELYMYEVLGICGPGETKKFIMEGNAEIGGRCAVNPSGGLLSSGHPLGASGARVVCEVTKHLRGEAGARQQPGAHVGLAQMVGGSLVNLGAPAVTYLSVLTC